MAETLYNSNLQVSRMSGDKKKKGKVVRKAKKGSPSTPCMIIDYGK